MVSRLRPPVHGATPSKGQTLRQRPNWSPLDPTMRLRAAGGRKGKPSIFFAPLPHQHLIIQRTVAHMLWMTPSPPDTEGVEHSRGWWSWWWWWWWSWWWWRWWWWWWWRWSWWWWWWWSFWWHHLGRVENLFALNGFCFGSCASIFAFAVCLFQPSSPTNTLPDLTVDRCRRQQPAGSSMAGSKHHIRLSGAVLAEGPPYAQHAAMSRHAQARVDAGVWATHEA